MKVLFALAVVAGMTLAGCGSGSSPGSKTPSGSATLSSGGVRPAQSSQQGAPTAALSDGNAPGIPPLTGEIKTDQGVRYIDEKVGDGASPQTGQNVTVQYTGWLTNGTKFDSSRDRNQPFSFIIGRRNVIAGWEIGVATMKVGGKRRLIIPSDLGYGPRGTGPIPGNAALIFDVELLSVQP